MFRGYRVEGSGFRVDLDCKEPKYLFRAPYYDFHIYKILKNVGSLGSRSGVEGLGVIGLRVQGLGMVLGFGIRGLRI